MAAITVGFMVKLSPTFTLDSESDAVLCLVLMYYNTIAALCASKIAYTSLISGTASGLLQCYLLSILMTV